MESSKVQSGRVPYLLLLLLLLLQTPGEDGNVAVCHLKMAACGRMEPPPLEQWGRQSRWVILLLSFPFLVVTVPV